ncbi:MAG: glycosyltransferase family 4 protein [bacterium]
MKLIYIANMRTPTEKAHGIQIMKMCEAFVKVGNEIELFAARRFNHLKQDVFEYYGIERIFKIKNFFCLDLMPLEKFFGGLAFLIQSFSFFVSVFIRVIFKKADVVYIRDKFLLPLCLFKNNIVFEAHDFPENYFLYSRFFRKTKKIIVITRKLKDLFIEKGVEEDKIFVSPDGTDIEKFDIQCDMTEARKKLRLPQDKKIIVYTGHLYQWKGADTLLQAAEKFKNINSGLEVLFVFVGGTEKDIADFEKKSENSNNIKIIGHRPHFEIPYWLKAANALVLPNSAKEKISKYWTSPLKLFEYMASGRPIVASDLPSLIEILNENNAILVKPDNSDDLAEGIFKALKGDELADKISRQAFNDVKNNTWLKRADNILKFINNAKC